MPGLTPPTPINPAPRLLVPSFVLQTPLVEEPYQVETPQNPTSPWMDLDFPSQLPVVPNVKPFRFDSDAPAFGFNPGFNVSDLDVTYASPKSQPIANVTANTTSATINMGVNRIDIAVAISDFTDTCALNIYQVDPVNGNVLIKSYTGINRFSTGLFVGGTVDGIALMGAPIQIEVLNITGGATVSVTIQGH
jgi:hypothetical protein